MSIPVEVKTGLVTGVFYRAGVDSSDADIEPDVTYAVGSGRLLPSVSAVLFEKDDNTQYRIQLEPVSFTIQNGTVTTPDGQPLRLVASHDQDASANPSDWYWLVHRLVVDGQRVSDYSIQVSPNTPADLVVQSPVPASPGDATVRGPKGDDGDSVLPSGLQLMPIVVEVNSVYPSRPVWYGPVNWIGADQPLTAEAGDIWDQVSP